MSYTSFDFEVRDHVGRIHLNRPEKRNCMTLSFWREMRQVFAEIDRRGEARAVVLTAAGPHFTAGIDLAFFQTLGQSGAELEESRRRERARRQVLHLQESFSVLVRCRVPVMAAVQGGCFGAGVDMITACDMRYCTGDAFFVVKEIELGMTADVGTLQRLPRVMPKGLARELAYTGRPLPAAEALASGFVNRVFDSVDEMEAGVLEVAGTIAAHSPLAVAGSKEMLNYAEDHSVEDGLNYIATWQAGMFATADVTAAFAAGQAKRPPSYAGLEPDLGLDGD